MGAPNFTLLNTSLPEIGRLISAMVQARDAVERRSWSHPQEPTGEEWWADVLADPRARKRERRADLAVKQAFYRLTDEKREIILVACSKCDWRAAFSRDDLIGSHEEEWWADVLADPRARKRERRADLAVKQAFYRLTDEKREIILVACSKCDWRAAFSRDDLIASHGADRWADVLADPRARKRERRAD